jgi:hypothetical protein
VCLGSGRQRAYPENYRNPALLTEEALFGVVELILTSA